jgi:translation initiation factor 2 beta subunit (eIF-2beta)/eIF-5
MENDRKKIKSVYKPDEINIISYNDESKEIIFKNQWIKEKIKGTLVLYNDNYILLEDCERLYE